MPTAFFVYGTLKRGEERAPLWPHPPVRIVEATTRGQLRDLGPYPAMVEGNDLVRGELWFIPSEHVAATLRTLDAIECFDQGGVDLYVRRTIACQTTAGETVEAFAYFYGEPERIADKPLVRPDSAGFCAWYARTG